MSIIIKNLTKQIGENLILKNINLELEKGYIYGFVGRNGSGKSMLLKTICGFVRPTNGQIIVNKVNIYKNNIFPADTNALIEKPKFLNELSGFDNLKLLASIKNKINDKEINEVLQKVNLYKEKDKLYGKYSLGMKQKLGIAQVLMENPKIMIFDEPFNGIENESVKKLRSLLLAEKKNDKLIIIATHIKEDVEILCDKVFIMDDGKIIDEK